MTKSWNFQTSAYQRLKSNFRVLDLIAIFFRTDMLHQDKKRWKQVKHHWLIWHLRWNTANQTIFYLRWKNELFFPSLPQFHITVVKISQSYFQLCDRKSWKFSWTMNCFFLHCHPISYFIIHVCNQKTDKHSEMWHQILKFSNFSKIRDENWSQILESLDLMSNFLGLMCYTCLIKKTDEKQVKHYWFDIIQPIRPCLRWKSLQSVVKTSQSYFLCDRKSWKFSWNELFFPSLPSYFLFHNTCLQSKNW